MFEGQSGRVELEGARSDDHVTGFHRNADRADVTGPVTQHSFWRIGFQPGSSDESELSGIGIESVYRDSAVHPFLN